MLQICLDRFSNNTKSLIKQQNSNLAEKYMRVRTNMEGAKAVHRGQKGAFAHRAHAAVLKYNNGVTWLISAWSELYPEMELPMGSMKHFKWVPIMSTCVRIIAALNSSVML